LDDDFWDDEEDWEFRSQRSRLFRRAFLLSGVIFLLIGVFILGRCSADDTGSAGMATSVSPTFGTLGTVPWVSPTSIVVPGSRVAVDSTAAAEPGHPEIGAVEVIPPEGTSTRMLTRVNYEREQEGLQPLKWCPSLARAATSHSIDMAERQYFEHISPDGLEVWDRAEAEGYVYRTIGENIAVGQGSVREVMDDWMDSPGHRKNLLDPEYEHFGLGIHTGQYEGRRAIYWTQNFGAGGDCR
jgi:uncharacterized protein YkwD